MESGIKSSSDDINILMDTFTQSSENPFSFDWTPHAPIEIDSDIDFLSLGFNGSGSEVDPYIIEDYIIRPNDDSTSAISITGTTRYFIIRDCYMDWGRTGIHIDNVEDNTVELINNICSFNTYTGIEISRSTGANLINNTCTHNEVFGILMTDSPYSILTNNICNNNLGNGLGLSENSFTSLFDNNFKGNGQYGILLGLDSDSCIITSNLFEETHFVAILVRSHENIIYNNTFIENNLFEYLGSSSQAHDEGKSNNWFNSETKKGNFWSDLGDKCKYAIDGSANSKDFYPLNRRLSCPNPITISAISIVIPLLIGGSILAFVTPKYILPYIKRKNIKDKTATLFKRIKI